MFLGAVTCSWPLLSWGPFCGSRCPQPPASAPPSPVPVLLLRTRPAIPSGPLILPSIHFSKEEGVSCVESVESCGRRVCQALVPPRPGEARRFLQPAALAWSAAAEGRASAGSLKPGPWVSFGFSFLSFEVRFCFSVFVCISFNVVKVALQVSLQRPQSEACPCRVPVS